MTLKDFGNIPFRLTALEAAFPNIRDIRVKAARLEDAGDIIRLKRGLYVVSPQVSGMPVDEFLVANHLHGPSYVSMLSALRHYGLIPEAVYEVQSVTTGVAKLYRNAIGSFRYTHCSPEAYRHGVTTVTQGNVSFMMATPEKALCDLMVFTPNLNLRYRDEMRRLLEEDWRLDMEAVAQMDTGLLRQCACHARKKTMINKLIELIENGRDV